MGLDGVVRSEVEAEGSMWGGRREHVHEGLRGRHAVKHATHQIIPSTSRGTRTRMRGGFRPPHLCRQCIKKQSQRGPKGPRSNLH